MEELLSPLPPGICSRPSLRGAGGKLLAAHENGFAPPLAVPALLIVVFIYASYQGKGWGNITGLRASARKISGGLAFARSSRRGIASGSVPKPKLTGTSPGIKAR